jgi:hypothetical protein
MGLPLGAVVENLAPDLFGLPVKLDRDRIKVIPRLRLRLKAAEAVVAANQGGAVLV